MLLNELIQEETNITDRRASDCSSSTTTSEDRWASPLCRNATNAQPLRSLVERDAQQVSQEWCDCASYYEQDQDDSSTIATCEDDDKWHSDGNASPVPPRRPPRRGLRPANGSPRLPLRR